MSPDEPDALAFLAALQQEASAKLQELEAYALHCSEHLNWHHLSGSDRAFIAKCKEGAHHAIVHLNNRPV